jgi:hypothetical protein
MAAPSLFPFLLENFKERAPIICSRSLHSLSLMTEDGNGGCSFGSVSVVVGVVAARGGWSSGVGVRCSAAGWVVGCAAPSDGGAGAAQGAGVGGALGTAAPLVMRRITASLRNCAISIANAGCPRWDSRYLNWSSPAFSRNDTIADDTSSCGCCSAGSRWTSTSKSATCQSGMSLRLSSDASRGSGPAALMSSLQSFSQLMCLSLSACRLRLKFSIFSSISVSRSLRLREDEGFSARDCPAHACCFCGISPAVGTRPGMQGGWCT